MIKIEGKKFDWFGLTQILKEHKGKLRQIRMLSVNELKKKYKGAALGPLWALIKPTFTLFILWFAFEIGLKRNGGVHFINGKYTQFVFMLTGYVPWFYISECIVAKNRHGNTGTVKMIWDGQFTRFSNMEMQHET